MIRRIVPIKEIRAHSHYADLADLADAFNHDVVEDDVGVWRWRPNGLVRHLLNDAPFCAGRAICGQPTIRGRLDLNGLWFDFCTGRFSVEEMAKFYMQMGYSLSGFVEVFGQHDVSEIDNIATDPKNATLADMSLLDFLLSRCRIARIHV